MKYVKTTLYMRLPDDFTESEIDDAIANTINEFGGQLIESTEYQEDNLYSDEDFETDYSSYSNEDFYS